MKVFTAKDVSKGLHGYKFEQPVVSQNGVQVSVENTIGARYKTSYVVKKINTNHHEKFDTFMQAMEYAEEIQN